MSLDGNRPVSGERDQGTDLARSAETLLAQAQASARCPSVDAQIGTARAVLALYWELRRQRPAEPSGMGIVRDGAAAERRSYWLGDHEPGS